MSSFANKGLFIERVVATFKFKLTALYNILAEAYNCEMPQISAFLNSLFQFYDQHQSFPVVFCSRKTLEEERGQDIYDTLNNIDFTAARLLRSTHTTTMQPRYGSVYQYLADWLRHSLNNCAQYDTFKNFLVIGGQGGSGKSTIITRLAKAMSWDFSNRNPNQTAFDRSPNAKVGAIRFIDETNVTDTSTSIRSTPNIFYHFRQFEAPIVRLQTTNMPPKPIEFIMATSAQCVGYPDYQDARIAYGHRYGLERPEYDYWNDQATRRFASLILPPRGLKIGTDTLKTFAEFYDGVFQPTGSTPYAIGQCLLRQFTTNELDLSWTEVGEAFISIWDIGACHSLLTGKRVGSTEADSVVVRDLFLDIFWGLVWLRSLDPSALMGLRSTLPFNGRH